MESQVKLTTDRLPYFAWSLYIENHHLMTVAEYQGRRPDLPPTSRLLRRRMRAC